MADKDRFGFSEKSYGKALSDAGKKGGAGKDKAFQNLDQQALDQAYGMDTSKYSGDLRDVIQNKNIDIARNQQRVAQRIAEDPTRAGFRGFLPSRTDLSGFRQNLGQGFENVSSLLSPRNILGGIASLALGVPFLGNILFGGLQEAQAEDTTGFALNPDTGTFQKFNPLTQEFTPDTDFTSPKFTPDDDLVRGDFNIVDRLAEAIAAPNISTGIKSLFAPRGLGLPGDFLDQSAVETQALDKPNALDILDALGIERGPVYTESTTPTINDEASLSSFRTPIVDPGVVTTTPVIDPMDTMTNFFAEQGALPDEMQQTFNNALINASAITPVQRPVQEKTVQAGIPMDRALDALMMNESSSTPTNVNFPTGDKRFDRFGRLRPTAFGPFQIRQGTFEDPGYSVNPSQGMPQGTGFFDVVDDYDLSRTAAENILSGFQEAGESGLSFSDETGNFGLNLDPLEQGFVSPEAIAAYNLGLKGISKFDDPLSAPYLNKPAMQNLLTEFGYLTD